MRTIETIVYDYDELSENAKEEAREWCAEHIADYDWWEFIYQDAKDVEIEITGFDLYRHDITGKLLNSAVAVAEKITKEHGEDTETAKTARAFLKKYVLIPNTDEEAQEEAEDEFLHAILEDYRIMLQREYEGMFEREYLEDAIRANEYTFKENGKRFG